jgi:hypothetical protein
MGLSGIGRSRGWGAGLAVAAVVAITPAEGRAFKIVGPPSATYTTSGSSTLLSSLTFTVYRSGDSSPPGTSLPVMLQFQTTGGSPLGTLPATLPPSGVLTIAPAPGATSMNNLVAVTGSDPGAAEVAWYNGSWTWQDHITLRCENTSVNCAALSLTTHWTIQGTPTIIASDTVAGTRRLTVVSSSFDIHWMGVDILTGLITGSTSAIVLSDGTTIGFTDGEILINNGLADFSHFLAPGIGFEGELQAGTSITIISSSNETPFTRQTVSAVPTTSPVPALGTTGAWLAAACLLAAGLLVLRRGGRGLARVRTGK